MLTTTKHRSDREQLRRVARRGRDFIIDRYGDNCYYCKAKLYLLGSGKIVDKYYINKRIKGTLKKVKYFTIEHIIPLIEGGTNHIDNTVPCCAECNELRNEEYKAKKAAEEVAALMAKNTEKEKKITEKVAKAVIAQKNQPYRDAKKVVDDLVSYWNSKITSSYTPNYHYFTPTTLNRGWLMLAPANIDQDNVMGSFVSYLPTIFTHVKDFYKCDNLYTIYRKKLTSLPFEMPLKKYREEVIKCFQEFLMEAHYKIEE